MKTKLKQTKKFTPFTVEINVETVGEAKLLFHVFNVQKLRDIILSGDYNGEIFFNNENLPENFNTDLSYEIMSELAKQGHYI